jgi:UDP-N-acetylmuramate--alanine ligase
MKTYYLTGIGGTGMCGLAQILVHKGVRVLGSDRGYDNGENKELFSKLKRIGIKIFPQDGSGVNSKIDKMIISRAVEAVNPDIVAGQRFKIPIVYRQDELKKIFSEKSGIAVAGTSGKTTVVGMVGCVLNNAGKDFTIVDGGIIKNYITKNDIGNVYLGKNLQICVETDESEGDLNGYCPEVGVITNIGADHMSYNKLMKVYEDFAREVKNILILNIDDSSSSMLLERSTLGKCKKVLYSISKKADFQAKNIKLYSTYSLFDVNGVIMRVNAPGIHNVSNALAAVCAGSVYGLSLKKISIGLECFKGIHRRFDVIGEANDIKIIDDYAHNPDKIKAALKTARLDNGRIIAVYQPHGYGPLRMFLKELATVFAENLTKKDFLFVPDVYYAGGTVNKEISSKNLIEEIRKIQKNSNCEYIADRNDIKDQVKKIAKKGDIILVMGARDATLHDWAKELGNRVFNVTPNKKNKSIRSTLSSVR